MARVSWNSDILAEFRAGYPQFDDFSDQQVEMAFNSAGLFIDNSDGGMVPYDPEKEIYDRKWLIFMLMCHFLTLEARGGGSVGNVSHAQEGSVSTGFQVPAAAQQAGYFGQTQCGLEFWQIMQRYLVGGRYYAYRKCACFRRAAFWPFRR